MALILDGTTGASAVQDSSVTDGKLSLTANSAQIKTALNANNGAPIYACRAWVNFNGDSTVAIRASGNVSSITDNGTGDYTVNFTTAIPDASYSVGSMGASAADPYRNISFSGTVAPTASALRITAYNNSSVGPEDAAYVAISVFR